jgi:hypothetical protein
MKRFQLSKELRLLGERQLASPTPPRAEVDELSVLGMDGRLSDD